MACWVPEAVSRYLCFPSASSTAEATGQMCSPGRWGALGPLAGQLRWMCGRAGACVAPVSLTQCSLFLLLKSSPANTPFHSPLFPFLCVRVSPTPSP